MIGRKRLLGVLTAALLGSLQIGVASATTYYVKQVAGGLDSNGCTSSMPCASINRAYSLASIGDSIEVYQGDYNESLSVSKRITLDNADGLAVMDGAQVVTSWTANGSPANWFAPWNHPFAASSPAGVAALNSSYPNYPLGKFPVRVFRNGTPLRNICDPTGAFVVPGSGQFCINYAAQKVYVGDNPSAQTMQVSNLQNAIDITPGGSGSTIRGMVVTKYAPSWNMQGDVAIEPNANNVTVDGLQGSDSAARTLYAHGNSGLVVENSNAMNNSEGGMSASSITSFTFSGNTFSQNNWFSGATPYTTQWLTTYDAGGLKITGGSGGTSAGFITANTASYNGGPGLWLDTNWSGITINDNLSLSNLNHGIYMEHGSSSYVINNNSQDNNPLNASGIGLSKTVGIELWNNRAERNYTNIRVTDSCDCTTGPASGNKIVNNSVGAGVLGDYDQIYVHDYCTDATTACSGAHYPQYGNTASIMVSVDDWNQFEKKLDNGAGGYEPDAPKQMGWDKVSGIPIQYSTLIQFRSDIPNRELNSQQFDCSVVACAPSMLTGAQLPAQVATPEGLTAGFAYGVGNNL
jgi:Right handed beta helix region